MDAGVVVEQVADLGALVGCVVVHDDVGLAVGVGLGDLLEESKEFMVAVHCAMRHSPATPSNHALPTWAPRSCRRGMTREAGVIC